MIWRLRIQLDADLISLIELDENMDFVFSITWLTILTCRLLSRVVPMKLNLP